MGCSLACDGPPFAGKEEPYQLRRRKVEIVVKNDFEKSPYGWASYDYHASIISEGHNIFIIPNWIDKDGPDDSNFIWTDHTRWSVDIPENPISVLPLLSYREWTGEDKIDLKNAEVSVYIGNHDLNLYGAKCYFWILGETNRSGRWHLIGNPLEVVSNKWKQAKFKLINDEDLWHNSWNSKDLKTSLNDMLGNVRSYGFSFRGFSAEPTGKFCISQFSIKK